MGRPRQTRVVTCVLVLLAGLVGGCGSGQDDTVASVSDRFYDAVAARDGAAACAVLAPETLSELEQAEGKRCAEAILAEKPPEVGAVESVSVFGTMAEVRYQEETVFLARFQTGWRVMAAICRPQPHAPYDCRLKGA